jgi:hypothetical protein
VSDHRQAAAQLAPLKQAAKALKGASWVLGRAGLAGHEVRRGSVATAPAQTHKQTQTGYATAEPGW